MGTTHTCTPLTSIMVSCENMTQYSHTHTAYHTTHVCVYRTTLINRVSITSSDQPCSCLEWSAVEHASLALVYAYSYDTTSVYIRLEFRIHSYHVFSSLKFSIIIHVHVHVHAARAVQFLYTCMVPQYISPVVKFSHLSREGLG